MSAGAVRGRRKRGDHEEAHENHERWLLTYADMITLLMVLFIVLFAISQVDQQKFSELRSGLAVSFGARQVPIGSTENVLHSSEKGELPPQLAPMLDNPQSAGTRKAGEDAVAAAERARAENQLRAAGREVDTLRDVQRKITEALKRQGLADHVRFHFDGRGLVVSIVTDAIVFAGDQAELLPGGQRILNAVGPALRPLPNSIEVDGHTNHLGVANPRYPTLWELSTARASRVVRYLIERSGVPATKLTAAGFAAERPLYPRHDLRAVTYNRRVEIVVLSSLSADERALLPTVAAGSAK